MSLFSFISTANIPIRSTRQRGFLVPLRERKDAQCNSAPNRRVAPMMAGGGPVRSTETDTPQKKFLDQLKGLEKVRIIVRNPVGILEAIATFDGLFFAKIPSGEYANLIDPVNNLDMHILLSGFRGVRFDIGVSRSKSKAPTYAIRLLGADKDDVVVSAFVQWDREPEDISPERIQVWKDLKAEYVKDDGDTFFFDE